MWDQLETWGDFDFSLVALSSFLTATRSIDELATFTSE
jgi:hypothetical protein